MRLFAPSLAFVDLETTGTRADGDRITEIGVVRVDTDGDGVRATEWSTLVDPGVPIPPAIVALTGITDAMVSGAPTFGSVAREVARLLDDAVFVAHNARFDYGFLKHAFARAGRPFTARVLCTVRLSRRLFPEAHGHGLDAVIARHGLAVSERHRALGDARALWAFVQTLYRELPEAALESAAKRILRIPSLPPQLAPDALDALPEAPGVYLFYGDNPLPLYVGKSVNLRERVAAHFSSDWRSETDLRLSQEIRRIDFEETAGELGALLREATLVKARMPAHNRALRRKAEAGVLTLTGTGTPAYLPAAAIEADALAGTFGPFASRAGAREALRALAAEHRLCWRRLGLERRPGGPCFQRQLRRCAGACVGEEDCAVHDARLALALAPQAVPRWPHPGIALVREQATFSERVDVHAIRNWCWLGSARDDGELASLLEAPPRPQFDIDVTRLLLRRYAAGTLAMLPACSRSERWDAAGA
ncbi:MAG: exonuclease domain-containing protein [Casimicrobiaceae bacterium]